MDILKVLSRGIKQPGKGAKQPGKGPTNLPSAGNRTNPQLFHDDVPSSRGSKRKRPKDEPERADDDTDLPEVDFFAPKKDAAEVKDGEGERDDEAAAAPNTQPESAPLKKPKLLSEDECRQLLRSHRLKLTLLSTRRKEPKVTKSKKKKKAVEVKEDALQVHTQPLHSFQELRSLYGISDALAANLHNERYRVPTEVQLGSLPLLLQPKTALKKVSNKSELGDFSAGIDFLAVAPTGSGKTVSFLIPAIDAVLRRRAGDAAVEPRLTTVIVAPTRELVFQIVNEGRKLVVGTGVKVAGFRKGTRLPEDEEKVVAVEKNEDDESEKEDDEDDVVEEHEEETVLEEADEDKAAASGDEEDEDNISSEDDERRKNATKRITSADILVTTPAMLYQYLTSGPENTLKTLPNVRSLVLDEADILLDPLFRDMTRGVWSACTNPSLRTSFWSATMGSNIETIARDMLASRPSPSPAPLVRLVVGLKDTAVPNITHKLVYTASEPGKLLALRQLLHPNSADDTGPPLRPPFIVFTQTIPRATALEEELKYDIPLSAGGPDRIAALHSGLTDTARASIMRRFRAGDIWVLITTDLLARGVDFAGVNGIVNYDIPGSTAAYVHRAGRTGRAGREGGVAVTFYTKDDIPFAKTVANVIALSDKQAGKTGDDAAIQQWLLDALPDVTKDDRKRLRERGVESRRTGNQASKITSQSGWERRRENNRQAAIEGSKKRRKEARRAAAGGSGGGADEEWGGIDG